MQLIIAEIKRSSDSLKKLRIAKANVEGRITAFLKEKDLPGVKYNENIILLRQKATSKAKPKKIRQGEIIDLLINSGVADPEGLLKKMNSIGREKITKDSITIDKSR